ncbi:uncharacterized protein LOC105426090 [Pogonomyrmex barbatus]|uniref:Uncharacterized protein LOC105426090 n=1 Tax=Pogonomyrmex barbatus TaxID=144034 RepID=A0A8N1S6R7_9HYME|nr:uncharacterized protein LOC105426090 [Pogonomyrmex barbatus]XP_025073798.1 uncharacterized protein LOC105426090 [Pogonomyrmex barbatus]
MPPKSWIWKYFHKIEDALLKCNICGSTVSIKSKMYTSHKIHLFYEHNICKEEEVDKWKMEEDPEPIWRNFKRGELYAAICDFCGETVEHAYKISNLHLHFSVHFDEIENSIINSWLKNHMRFNRSVEKPYCYYCKDFLNISPKVQDLKDHLFVIHNLRDTTKRMRTDKDTEEGSADVSKQAEENKPSTSFQ